LLKRYVIVGVISSAISFKNQPWILSGPVALCCLMCLSRLLHHTIE
jgi:hypothetical protein